tara:strand:- start:296 stop:1249 length:954 start_codon:yes stop_codon:yes gene_type:complete
MHQFLDFEKTISILQGKIEDLRLISSGDGINVGSEISKLEEQLENNIVNTYQNLTAWDKVKVARHPQRPHASYIISSIIDDWQILAGDRSYAEDNSILGGIGRFNGKSIMVIGIEKGNTTEKRIYHNFGMVRPEGYRKARRLIEIAEKFKIPILTLIDTPGAYPGKGAEERGQAEAIAKCIQKSLTSTVPMISIITGEGGSGGAAALATGDIVLMMEHSIYSVISPEGCSSILWRSASKADIAANTLKLTAQDLYKLKIIDNIIPEPIGAAHRDPNGMIKFLKEEVKTYLEKLLSLSKSDLIEKRREKFLKMSFLNN